MAQAGCEEEFDAFVVQAWPRLRWTALMLTRDDHLAEDLAQTALIRTYAAWGRVRREDAFSYARKVLVNANIDRMRRRRLSEVHEAMEVAVESGGAAVEDRDALLRVLDCLTLKERKVLVLRHYYELTEVAVAAELGISLGTVKSTASRALTKVREHHPDLAAPTWRPRPGCPDIAAPTLLPERSDLT